MERNHFQIVKEGLDKKQIDGKTAASLEILSERLERLKKYRQGFSGISFSPDVKKILRQKTVVLS